MEDTRFTNRKNRPEIYNILQRNGWWWVKNNHGMIIHPEKHIYGVWKNMWGGFKICAHLSDGSSYYEFGGELYIKSGTEDYSHIEKYFNLAKEGFWGQDKIEFEPIKK